MIVYLTCPEAYATLAANHAIKFDFKYTPSSSFTTIGGWSEKMEEILTKILNALDLN